MGLFYSRSFGSARDNDENANDEDNSAEYKFRPLVFRHVSCGEGIWPRARSGHKIVSNCNEIFSYGGYNPDSVGSDLGLDDEVWMESKPLFR